MPRGRSRPSAVNTGAPGPRSSVQNFDTIRYDYYRDSTVAIEAFTPAK
jgi:hypothetical protein